MHISDLHFNKIDQDKKKAFESDLAEHDPTVIVITGDLINSPWSKTNFVKAKEFIKMLEQTAELIIIAPGNHEKLFKISNKKFENEFSIKPFYYRYEKFADNIHMAFFVFDSTRSFLSQRGKINKDQIDCFNQCVDDLRRTYAQDYERSFKIAVLHHHPLPTKKNHFDKYLYLKNPGEFFENLIQQNINMVLHGHQHDPVEYSFQWDLRYIYPQPHIVIISAGTLLKDEKNKDSLVLCERTNYCLMDIHNETFNGYQYIINGRQFYYDYALKEFTPVKLFLEKSRLPKYYKHHVDLTWKITHPNYDNEVTRKLTFRAWADEEINEIKEIIGSDVKEDIKNLQLNVYREGIGAISYDYEEKRKSTGYFKHRFSQIINRH